jgi:hypothetical protein
MSVRPATRARIEAAHRFAGTYRGYLANHLPMALVALDRMGADDAVLERFERAHVATRLEPVADHPEFQRSVETWAARLASEGTGVVLPDALGRLVAGLGSGAFHGAIRAAYALECGSERELAHALAYWDEAFQALPTPPPLTGHQTPYEALVAMSRDPRFAKQRFPGRNIVERSHAAAGHSAFTGLVARVDASKLSLASLAGALIRVYAASGDFTVLHGVTGTHAFRLLAPHATESRAALAHLWQAVVAAYLGAGSPAVEGWGLAGSDALSWAEIRERAIRCEDEHDVKLAYSCWQEGEHYGDDLYRRAASARVCHALRETVAC